MHTFNQPQDSEYRWTKDHPLTQVRGNPSKPVQTRRQLATDPEMCVFAVTVSIVEPKNIKEAMADSAWIEAMQEELHQFDRLQVWELVDKPFGKKPQGLIAHEEVFELKNQIAPVDRLEAVRKFFGAYVAHKSFSNCIRSGRENDIFLMSNMKERTSDPPIPTRYHSHETLLSEKKKNTIAKGSGFELTAFSDVDHTGCVDTRKSTSGGIQFLGDKLISWISKKQDCTAMSSAEAEYVALSASCAQHSRTKHIHTRYHFIKEHVENGIIELYFVISEYQLADMFTKALPEERFQYLVRRIGMRCLTLAELEGSDKESA
ncbi:hypothetical protein Tco_1052720 [Tanacetum coccineum]